MKATFQLNKKQSNRNASSANPIVRNNLAKLTRVSVLLGYFLGLSLLTCAQELSISETQKVKRKSAVVYGQYVTKADLSFPVENIHEIKMSTGAGKLEVKSSESNQVEMEAIIENRSLSSRKARKFIEKYLHLAMENVNGQLEIKSYFQGNPRRWNSKRYGLGHIIETPGQKIHVILKVPKSVALKLKDRSGPIYLHDLDNDILVKDGSGGIDIKNTKGTLEVIDGSGNLEINNHEGDLKVRDGSGGIILNGIGMESKNYTISIADGSGKIYAEGLGGDVSMRDASGAIVLKNVIGRINAIDRSGGFRVYGAGKAIDIKDRSGSITLKDIASMESGRGEILIKDTSGSIYLRNAGTSAKIVDKSGGVHVMDVQGNLSVRDRSGKISTKNVSGVVSIRDRSGKVTGDNYLVKNQ